MKRLVVAVTSAVLLSACGSGVAPTGGSRAAPVASQTPTPAATESERAASGNTGQPSSPEHSAQARPRATSSKATKGNDLPLSVTMSRSCVEPGQEMKIVAETVPGAQVGFSAYYPGNNSFPPDAFFVASEANVTGTVTWAFVVRPATPHGKAQVDVLAMKPPRGSTFAGSFVVSAAC